MIRSINKLWQVDLGFRPGDHLVSFAFNLSPALRGHSTKEMRVEAKEVTERIKAVPGVRYVSFSAGAFPLLDEQDMAFWINDRARPTNPDEIFNAIDYRVEPDYFKAVGIPLKRGRLYTDQDNEWAPPVIVIDEVFAHKIFGNEDPIGKYIKQEIRPAQQIIGIVGHVKHWSIDSDESHSLQAQFYEPFKQVGGRWQELRVLVGVDEGAKVPFAAIREAIHSHDPQNVISKPETLTETIANALADRRSIMVQLDVFAIVALVLASIGLYGVISYLVGQRTQELGIRLALGAQRKDIFRLVLSHGMKMALVGVALGLIAAFALTRVVSRLLYGVSATDLPTFAVIASLVTAVAVLACVIPARRATKVNPLVALRYE
jgi:predicted permease